MVGCVFLSVQLRYEHLSVCTTVRTVVPCGVWCSEVRQHFILVLWSTKCQGDNARNPWLPRTYLRAAPGDNERVMAVVIGIPENKKNII